MNYTITRLPFIVSAYAYQFLIMGLMAEESAATWCLALISMPLFALLLAVPRARDCGWPPWIGWLSMIPVLGFITSTALLFGATRTGLFEKDPDASDPEGNDLSQDIEEDDPGR